MFKSKEKLRKQNIEADVTATWIIQGCHNYCSTCRAVAGPDPNERCSNCAARFTRVAPVQPWDDAVRRTLSYHTRLICIEPTAAHLAIVAEHAPAAKRGKNRLQLA